MWAGIKGPFHGCRANASQIRSSPDDVKLGLKANNNIAIKTMDQPQKMVCRYLPPNGRNEAKLRKRLPFIFSPCVVADEHRI